MGKELLIRVPASSANLGPGFDALSIGIGVYLNIKVSIEAEAAAPTLSLSYDGVSASTVAVDVEANLISKTVSRYKYESNFKLFLHYHFIYEDITSHW